MTQQPPNYGQPDQTPNQPPAYQPPPGYQPQPGQQPPPGYPPKKRGGCLKIGGLVVLAVVALAVVIQIATGGTTASSTATISADTKSTSAAASATQQASETQAAAPTTTAASKPAATGNTVTIEMSKGTATATIYSAKWSTKGLVAPDNGAYLILDIGFVGETGSFSYNPLYLKVQDADGREYNIAFGADAKPALSSGDLSTGQKARGFVAFDVPKGTVTLKFANELLQDTGASIQIAG